MKIKKSKFAKLLTLALPIAAISIVTPVVLTSCGSSNSTTTPDKPDNGGTGGGGTSGGGNTGGSTQSYTASWKSDNQISGLTINNDDSRATITLGDSQFAQTTITKNSKLADIEASLAPPTASSETKTMNVKDGTTSTPSTDSTKTLYSVLSSIISNVDKFTVTLSIDPNPVSFDFSNSNIGNTFSGQFKLTPIASINSGSATTLNFTINNFDDSTNISNTLTWDTDAVTNALKKGTPNTGNNISDDAVVKTMGGGASAVIDLSKLSSDKKPTYSQVMNELCNTSITGDEVKSFIKTTNQDIYDVSQATFSAWAPTVDKKMVFTRIVIPCKDNTKSSAIMYLAYTGYTDDSGSAAWNRNLGYYNSNPSNDLWDKKYNEPVINLGTDKLWNTNITSSTKATDIIAKKQDLVDYIAQNYILDVGNFDLDDSVDSATIGKFTQDGTFVANQSKEVAQTENSSITTNNNNVIEIKFFLKLRGDKAELPNALDGKTPLNGYGDNKNAKGFWKAFYITGYSV